MSSLEEGRYCLEISVYMLQLDVRLSKLAVMIDWLLHF